MAVLRLPLRERGGAGVTMQILNSALAAKLWCDYNKASRMRALQSFVSGAGVDAAALRRMLVDARTRTRAHAASLAGGELLGPQLPIVNPPLWEIGHVGWFQERWCLREEGRGVLGTSILAGADALYDSAQVAHATRWTLPLPNLERTLGYLDSVLERVCQRLEQRRVSADLAYFAQLAAFHEEMHCEAFAYSRQTLSMSQPPDLPAGEPAAGGACSGDALIHAGEFELGATPDDGFVFDNEKWAHPVHVATFSISRAAVTSGEFAAFVDDDGYERREFWTDEGWDWRRRVGATHPVYWHPDGERWFERRFDRIVPLAPGKPVMHVNRFEAQAYCRWAGRRLPTEAEWEYAAAHAPGEKKRRYPWGSALPDAGLANLYAVAAGPIDVAALPRGDSAAGCRQMLGNVWEWTADAFLPYPGFTADPYKEYSEPWFGSHAVLRGGSFVTRAGLMRNTWRNFYTPDRRDVFAGFRTCAA
jgi:iron(II)-dependent oxidoreductase